MGIVSRKSLFALLGLASLPLWAAEPASDTLSPAMPETRFESGPFLTSGGVFCSLTGGCDSYELTVELPADEAMEGVAEEPVVDPEATATPAADEAADQSADEAGAAAEEAAAAVAAAAAGEAEQATE